MQKGIQALELRLPELAVLLKPLDGVAERSRFQSPWTPLRISSAGDQSCAFHYFKVLGDGWLGHGERLCQLHYRGLALGQSSQDGSARGIGQRRKGCVETSRRPGITRWFHNRVEIYKERDVSVKVIRSHVTIVVYATLGEAAWQ